MDNNSLELIIGIEFNNKDLLKIALTHKSYSEYKKTVESNQRLEFFGDSILGLIISEALFAHSGSLSEGEMTKLKSSLVSEKSLAECAREIRIGEFLYLNKGEEKSFGRDKDSILADAFEALVAAIYLDQGFSKTKDFILKLFKSKLDSPFSAKDTDYKTALQEITQKQVNMTPEYEMIRKSGPEHRPIFSVEVFLGGWPLGTGTGKSIKLAEQDAAKNVINMFRLDTVPLEEVGFIGLCP